jgi:hypothetical protein
MRIKTDIRATTEMLKNAEDVADTLVQRGYEYFRDKTPVRSGNARRNTRRDRDSIVADYMYAERLDQGYSNQAPKGMSDPTIDYIQQQLDIEVRKLNNG